MHICETCGNEWPENYCPECGHTIGKAATSAVPPLLHPPLPTPKPPATPTRLFGFFKKREPEPPADQPHPHHRNFVRMFIPDALARNRNGFLAAMSDPQASRTLQEAWQKCGARVLPRELVAPSTGLNVSAFRHESFLCLLIIFPPPKVAGESYFGLVVAGPSDDWSPEARAKVPVRYFILERSAMDSSTIFEWRPSTTDGDELFDNLGSGSSPQNPPHFVEAILSRFYGLKPSAS
jgi:hypothetical protein